jgi:hypothetical protein
MRKHIQKSTEIQGCGEDDQQEAMRLRSGALNSRVAQGKSNGNADALHSPGRTIFT